MRLLLFIGSLDTGGAQHQYAQIAKGLASRGHDIFVITVYPGGQFWRLLEQCDRVMLLSLCNSKSPHVLDRGVQHLWVVHHLRHIIRNNQIDLVYSSLYLSNLLAWLALRNRHQTSLTWGIRASKKDFGWKRAIPFHLCRFVSPSVPMLISNSQEGLTYHKQAGYRSPYSVVIPNGFDLDRYKPDGDQRNSQRAQWAIDETDVLIGIVGRLTPVKNHSTFLEAAAQLDRQYHNVRYVCVGDGQASYRQELIDLGISLGLKEKVIWTGTLEDMPAAYNAIDILTSSSFSEGFSNAIGEAMACGVPCVVTNVGDSALIVGGTGEIVAPRNPEALSTAWQKLIELGIEARAKLGLKARRRIEENFSLSFIIDCYEELFYQQLSR